MTISKTRTQNPNNPTCILILRDLEYGPSTSEDLAEALGMSRNSIERNINALRLANRVRIAGYERTKRKPTRIYGIKESEDQRDAGFKKMTGAQRSMKWKNKQKEKQIENVYYIQNYRKAA